MCVKFKLSSSNSFRDLRGPKKKRGRVAESLSLDVLLHALTQSCVMHTVLHH